MQRFMIVDQDPMIGQAYSGIVREYLPGIEYCGQVTDRRKMISAVRKWSPEILFIDPDTYSGSRLSDIDALRQSFPSCTLIVLSISDDPACIQYAYSHGAFEYLQKPLGFSDFYNMMTRLSHAKKGNSADDSGENAPGSSYPAVQNPTYADFGRELVLHLLNGEFDEFRRKILVWKTNHFENRHRTTAYTYQRTIALTSELHFNSTKIRPSDLENLLFNSFLGTSTSAKSPEEMLQVFDEYTEKLIQAYSESTTSSAMDLISQIQNIVETRYHEPISLEQIASDLFFSTAYVSRTFKKITGRNFLDYLTDKRLEKAQQLLLTTDNPVEEISAAAGYDNPSSFRRMFKKRTGVSPNQFRKNKLHSNAAD